MERDAVDGEDVVLEVEIVFENVAHQSCEVVVGSRKWDIVKF